MLNWVILSGGTRYYHASPKVFRRGDILTGSHPGGFGYEHPNVCLTTGVKPHVTIFEKAVEGNWYIYEVEPLYKVHYEPGNAELQTKAAKVLGQVGRAGRFKNWSKVIGPPKGSKGPKGESRAPWRMERSKPSPTRDRLEVWIETLPFLSSQVLTKLDAEAQGMGIQSTSLPEVLKQYAYQVGFNGGSNLKGWISELGRKLRVDVQKELRNGGYERERQEGKTAAEVCKIQEWIVKAGTMDKISSREALKFLQKMSKGIKGLVSVQLLREALKLMGWGMVDLDVTVLTNGTEKAEYWLKDWAKDFQMGSSLTKKDPFLIYVKGNSEADLRKAVDRVSGYAKIVSGEPSGGSPGDVFITKPEIILKAGYLRSHIQIDKIWIVVPGWRITASNGKSEVFPHSMGSDGRLVDPGKMDSFWTWAYKNGLKESALSTLGAMDAEVVEEALAPKHEKPSVKRSFSREVQKVWEEVVDAEYQGVVLALTKNALNALEAYFEAREGKKGSFTPLDFIKTPVGKKWIFFYEAVGEMLEKGTFSRVSNYHAKARAWAESIAEIARRDFVQKNTVKLSEIVNAKDNLKEAKILSTGGGLFEGEVKFSFEDGSSFVVRNKTVYKVSQLGRPFFQYPTTFHDVILPDGKRMPGVSEKAMVERFPKG